MADKFGMMSQAYFKGKRELLEWCSNFLQMDIPKVETLASGAHYCQLLDALYPGSMKMSKIKFDAYLEEHYVQNWKLVQIAFEKQGIQKLIPVLRLVKARFQDNLEFLQWFHQYFQSTYHAGDYDAPGRRRRCKGADKVVWKGQTSSSSNAPSSRAPAQRRRKESSRQTSSRVKTSEARSNISHNHNPEKDAAMKRENAALLEEKEALTKELQRIESTAKAIESERDFYFNVLLKVETLCKESANASHPCIQKIREILYASNDSPQPEAAAPAATSEAQAQGSEGQKDGFGEESLLVGMDDMVEG